jgi:hypothetical protein
MLLDEVLEARTASAARALTELRILSSRFRQMLV